jgi:hypothetical protein
MTRKWHDLDLNGGGLQALNRRLSGELLKRRTAWLLALPLPLGLYHWYLGRPLRGLIHLAACCAAALLALTGAGMLATLLLGALTAVAVHDLIRMENRIADANKAKRLSAYLGAGSGPPAGFRGRYTDDNR